LGGCEHGLYFGSTYDLKGQGLNTFSSGQILKDGTLYTLQQDQ